MANLEFFKNKHIIFYTLILEEQECETFAQNEEFLSDFLENKICVLLNLRLDGEYFLKYTKARSESAYNCVLLDKESLKDCASGADSYLTHPSFLCAQLLDNALNCQFFLVLDKFLDFTLIGFVGGDMVFLQQLEQKDVICKLEQCKFDYSDFALFIWDLRDSKAIDSTTEVFFAEIDAKFNATKIETKLESLELLDDYNFNPLEAEIPFFKQNLGKAAQSLIAGAALGIVVSAVMLGLFYIARLEENELKAQIENIARENKKTQESYTNAQNEILKLQEKLESLQKTHSTNAALLQNIAPKSISPTSFIQMLNPYLEKHNVKIAYFGVQNQDLHLLFVGKETLRILEILEAKSLGNIRGLEYYNEFIWVEIVPNVEVLG